MKSKMLISVLILIGFGFILINSCKKEEAPPPLTIIPHQPQVATEKVTVTSNNTADVVSRIDWDGAETLSSYGICWSEEAVSSEPTIDLATKTTHNPGSPAEYAYPGRFTDQMTDLTLFKTYYVRAYAANNQGLVYGHVLKFTVLTIGTSYQGGIIAYIFASGDPGCSYYLGTHGLIAAPSDLNTGIQWYNGNFITTRAKQTALLTGHMNTDSILANQGFGAYAAQLCADLSLGGYSDWFLPSRDELNKLLLNRNAIGGFSNDEYWSSTQITDTIALSINFNDSLMVESRKDTTLHVRAIRSF